jgi:sterol desaturase/sphingolipid hydroxylase (fatty acid hydroxylase superfamily)
MTNYRVHPVDTVVFYNVLAVFVGLAGGVLTYLLGPASDPFALSGTNLILAGFLFATIHLQHSHLWIPAPGRLGRVLLSPAHHQLHHSTNPQHFNKNFGSCLAVWDWLFGTLQIPTRKRQRLTFGIEPLQRSHHTVIGALVMPVFQALAKLIPWGRQPVPTSPPVVEG